MPKLLNVRIGSKVLPVSEGSAERVNTSILIFRYENQNGAEKPYEGESERWLREDRYDSISSELKTIGQSVGKTIDLTENGLKNLVALSRQELEKIPIEVRTDTRTHKDFMSFLTIARTEAEIDAAIKNALKMMPTKSSSTGSDSGSSRVRPE